LTTLYQLQILLSFRWKDKIAVCGKREKMVNVAVVVHGKTLS